MKKSDKKDFVFSKLLELLKTQDFYLVKTGLDPTFVLKEKDHTISFFFNFKDVGEIDFSKVRLTLNVVEEIMFEIKLPNQDYSTLDNKKYFLITIEDKISVMPEGYQSGIGYNVETQEQLDFFTNWIINYLEKEGKEFIKKFTYLPNVLKEMDKLEHDGKYWNELLAGGPEFLFRGLIISKLCNDEKYENKLLYVKSLLKSMADEYLTYFEKLKFRLENLEPKYNI
ncbi:hypothetical protein SGQ44_06280 [Flavobacterium sp. Fl-77]|uniref:Uncharacterized protein n=1 Tax=Flavobacterium flavipigmentatum TaxID=2893884 RepID=A0AAJ2SF72_9FLAO|nr:MULTISPECIES: hypothetical protein [unclassified Flavobacterium]MDX6181610.1 hypothetical protein [Flavobacterium sp. Fl-33]MDX6185356.1 hypothetical protein [Flavobacterium sp. Fl-77]UFH37460.1 hypothetical protein LNP22_12010 [Flavobacterium sp. F-70]